MSMKKILVALMSMTLLFTTIPVSAAEDDITVTTKQSCYTPTDENNEVIGETVYTLSALKRDYYQRIDMPIEHELMLTSKTIDLRKITAEMDTESDKGLGKKDIRLWFDDGRTENEARLEVNFANDKVTTTLNQNAGILIKKDGKVIKRLPFMYSTPALTDEHDAPRFHTLSLWSGTYKYNYDLEDYYKISGTVDVYAKNPKISYTYKALGTYGLKNFLLNMDNDKTKTNNCFTFTNGKITIGAKNGIGDNGQGCVIGGAMDPIYLGFYATVKPAGKVKITSYKKTKRTIKLKWKKLSTPVSGYMIYRSTRKSSGYKKIKTVSSKTSSYTNKRLKRGKTYYYKIRPYRTVKYSYKTSKKKTKTLSRKAYGSYGYVKKIKTKR